MNNQPTNLETTNGKNKVEWTETGKIVDTAKQEEYLILTDGDGIFTGEIEKRSLSHKEWLPHYSVHVWVVDPNRFADDIWVYICKKAKKKSGWYYQFRAAGGHVGVTSEWKMEWDEEEVRKSVLEDAARREVEEELWLWLKENGEIIDEKTGEVLEKDGKFRVLQDKVPYQAVKNKMKNGEPVVEKNNEHIGIYAFEFSWDITNVDENEIERIDVISSKDLMEKLEWDGSFFGHKKPETWKDSNKYRVATQIVRQLQEEYGVK